MEPRDLHRYSGSGPCRNWQLRCRSHVAEEGAGQCFRTRQSRHAFASRTLQVWQTIPHVTEGLSHHVAVLRGSATLCERSWRSDGMSDLAEVQDLLTLTESAMVWYADVIDTRHPPPLRADAPT